jgi:hypothetical protein
VPREPSDPQYHYAWNGNGEAANEKANFSLRDQPYEASSFAHQQCYCTQNDIQKYQTDSINWGVRTEPIQELCVAEDAANDSYADVAHIPAGP